MVGNLPIILLWGTHKGAPRFNTDANEAGVEKIAVCAVDPSLVKTPIPAVRADEIAQFAIQGSMGKEYLEPMSVFYVKGFTRCFCAIGCLLFAYYNPDVLKAGRWLNT